MNDTPKTDAAAIRCACSTYVVPSEFARELERENAALRELLVRWERLAAIGIVDLVPDWAAPVVTKLAVDTSAAINARSGT